MKTTILLSVTLLIVLVSGFAIGAQNKTRNVILITLDGARNQEIFGGLDTEIFLSADKNAEQSLHILRNFAFEPAIFTINRMNKSDHSGVQRLTIEPQLLQDLAVRRPGPSIDRIAE